MQFLTRKTNLRQIRPQRFGAASPQLLSFLIITGGFIGVLLLWFIEPYLMVKPADTNDVRETNRIKDPVSVKEITENTTYMKSQIVGLVRALNEADNLLNNNLGGLVDSITPDGNGFSCPSLDHFRYTLQQYQPNILYIKDWIKNNRRRVEDQIMQGKLTKIEGQFTSLVKQVDLVIATFQSFQNAKYEKAAKTAFGKLPNRFHQMFRLAERLQDIVEKDF
jgi:hypothetical protein